MFYLYESQDRWIKSIYCILVINLEILTYRSALRKVFQDKTEKCLDNAAVYVDLTEEEILWLGTQHNNKQHLFRQASAQDYVSINKNYFNLFLNNI